MTNTQWDVKEGKEREKRKENRKKKARSHFSTLVNRSLRLLHTFNVKDKQEKTKTFFISFFNHTSKWLMH